MEFTRGMKSDDLRDRFAALQIWQENGQRRAPHKPLLVLWAIEGCLLRGENCLVSYQDADRALKDLLGKV